MKIGVQLVNKNENMASTILSFERTDWYKVKPEYADLDDLDSVEDDAFEEDVEVGDPEANVFRNPQAGILKVTVTSEEAEQFDTGYHYALTISPKPLSFKEDAGG